MTSLINAHRAVIDAERRAQFYRSWSAAYGMGSTYLDTMQNLGMEFKGGATERVRRYFAATSDKRMTLIDAIKKAPKGLLEPFESAIIKLGEETGSLDRSLRLLGDWFQGQHKLLIRLWSRSAYPLFLTLFAAVGLPLPLLIQGRTSDYLIRAGVGVALWWFFGGTIVFIPARFASGRGKWVRARLARSLATGMQAGAPLDRVLELAVAAAANPELKQCVEKVPLLKRRQQPISVTLKGCPHVPAELLAAMQVAENTGNWQDTVGRMGELYEDGF
jgi:type II secretory pathway component PulF